MEKLIKEFKLELRKSNNRLYIKVTNIITNKIGFIYNNDKKECFCGYDFYLETTGKDLINNLTK